MDSSSLDQPTLRIQLDRLSEDKKVLNARMNEEQTKLQSILNTIEQYKGAISYNQSLIDAITKEVEALNEAAFTKTARSIKDEATVFTPPSP